MRRNARINASEMAGASEIFLFFDLQMSVKKIPSKIPATAAITAPLKPRNSIRHIESFAGP